jgi:hypothetical protein
MSFTCKNCPAVGRCDQCRRRNREAERRRAADDAAAGRRGDVPKGVARVAAVEIIRLATIGVAPIDDPYLLREDGITDLHAINIVVNGRRHERLTYAERVEAATEIIRRGGTAKEICANLALPRMITETECQNSTNMTVRRLLGSIG